MVFLSDYGLEDEFVGAVHLVIAKLAPRVQVLDLVHRLPPHDVRAGSLVLWRMAPWLRDSVVLAVVDPGVGGARRPVAVEVAPAGTVLVGPDNGLLLPAAQSLGGVTAAVRLRRPPPLPGVPVGLGATFDGRDLFAPTAAMIASGQVAFEDLGDRLDPVTLAGEPVGIARPEPGGRLTCEVLWVDRFGNAQLNVRAGDLEHLGGEAVVEAGDRSRRARLVGAFDELGPDELGLVIDSYGFLALALRGAPAATALGVGVGDTVTLGPVDRA